MGRIFSRFIQRKIWRGARRNSQELPISESEVKWALDHLPNNKAPGCDNIPIELLKVVKEDAVPIFTDLCNIIWSAQIIESSP